MNSLDKSIYARRHLIRCLGAKHGKTGLYKIELDPSELNLTFDEIKKLATKPRDNLYSVEDLPTQKNEDAITVFKSLFNKAETIVAEEDYRAVSPDYFNIVKGMGQAPACVLDLIENNIRVQGSRNRATLVLTTYLKDNGKTKKDILKELIPWAKKMPSHLTSADEIKRVNHVKEICDFVFSPSGKDYHFTCAYIRSLGNREKPIQCKARCQLKIGQGGSKKIERMQETMVSTPVSFLQLEDGRLAETVFDPQTKKGQFAVYNPSNDTVIYQDKIAIDYLEEYIPLIDESIENALKRVVLLPSKAEEYDNEDILYREIGGFFWKYFNEPKKMYRTINVCYVLFSWVYDKFRSWCYLQWLGRAGGGKSRGLESIGYLCYKPILLSGADSSASMFRILDRYQGTALIDEATFLKHSESHNAITQILNVGYKRGGSVGRCEGDDNHPVRYGVAGPKLLATRVGLADDGLRSRCIVRRTGKDNRIRDGEEKQPFILPDNFEKEALGIRNKLLMWRFRKWHKARLNPDIEIKEVESRLNEILVPILSVTDSKDILSEVKELAREQQEDLKEIRHSSFEGEILMAIKKIGLSYDIPSSDIKKEIIKEREPKDKDRRLSTHRVTKALQRLELEIQKIGNRYVLLANSQNEESLQGLFQDYNVTDEKEKGLLEELIEDPKLTNEVDSSS